MEDEKEKFTVPKLHFIRNDNSLEQPTAPGNSAFIAEMLDVLIRMAASEERYTLAYLLTMARKEAMDKTAKGS